MTKEQEAEKAWEKGAVTFVKECVSEIVFPTVRSSAISGYIIGIKDYKASLKAAIATRIKDHPGKYQSSSVRGIYFICIEELFDLIDTCKPLEPKQLNKKV